MSEMPEVSEFIEISLRLLHDTLLMIEYALSSDKEAGGFLIKALHGKLGVIAEQFGKDREIVIEPNEELYDGELYFGSSHVHPVTNAFSIGDVSSFLADELELVMMLGGADSSMNIAIKVPNVTKIGDFRTELEEKYPPHEIVNGMSDFQKALPEVADDYGFLLYRATKEQENRLQLLNKKVSSSNEVAPIEELIDYLGLKGMDILPEGYATKKLPKKVGDEKFEANATKLLAYLYLI